MDHTTVKGMVSNLAMTSSCVLRFPFRRYPNLSAFESLQKQLMRKEYSLMHQHLCSSWKKTSSFVVRCRGVLDGKPDPVFVAFNSAFLLIVLYHLLSKLFAAFTLSYLSTFATWVASRDPTNKTYCGVSVNDR